MGDDSRTLEAATRNEVGLTNEINSCILFCTIHFSPLSRRGANEQFFGNLKIFDNLGGGKQVYTPERLDQLLRLGTLNDAAVIAYFQKAATEVSTPVLLQTMTHFANREEGAIFVSSFQKGMLPRLRPSAIN